MAEKPTYSGVQHQVINSPNPPKQSPQNDHAINIAIAAAEKGRKK